MVTAGMLPRAAVREVEARLRAAGCPDSDFDAAELFRLAAGGDARLADAPLGAEQAERLESLTARRAAREPLQYLCGSWPFLDFELAVGPGVLCPRADTEVVAEAAAGMLAGVEAPRVLDLCAYDRLFGAGREALLPGGTGHQSGEEPCGIPLSGAERPSLPGTDHHPGAGRSVHLLEDPAGGAARPHCVEPALPDLRRDGRTAARGGAGACHGAGSGGRMGWYFTAPLRNTTRKLCAPAVPLPWRSAGSSGKL